MRKDTLEKLQKQLEEVLPSDEFEKLRTKLLKGIKERDRELLAEKIAEKLKPLLEELNPKKIVEAIKEIKIEPKIEVKVPEIKIPEIKAPNIVIPEIKVPEIEIPNIEMPEIKIPKPVITINPPEVKVNIPKIDLSKEIRIKDLEDFIKGANELLKRNPWEGINRDNPLSVILTDEKGMPYRAFATMVGGGGSRIADLTLGYEIYFKEINVATIGDNRIVAAIPDHEIRVLSYFLVTDADVACRWKSGAVKNLTGAMSFAARSGIASPVGSPSSGALLKTEKGQALILNLSVAVGVRGHLSYYLVKI